MGSKEIADSIDQFDSFVTLFHVLSRNDRKQQRLYQKGIHTDAPVVSEIANFYF